MVESIKILRMLEDIHFHKKHNHLLESHFFNPLKNKRIDLYPRPGDVGVGTQVKNNRVFCQSRFSYYKDVSYLYVT